MAFHVCYNCKNRTITCHIDCPLYLEEVEKNNKRLKEQRIDNMVSDTMIKNRNKRLKTQPINGSNTHKKVRVKKG